MSWVVALTGLFWRYQDDEKAKSIHEPGDAAHEMSVYDGWHRADDFSVDKEGSAIKNFTPSYAPDQWENEAMVKEQFYPGVVQFLKKTTGAKRVLVFDHTIRTKKNANKKITDETNTTARAPVSLVHCDYTAESGPLRVQQLLPSEAESLLSNRVAFYNIWKPLYRVEENPLAMSDVTTSPSEDFFQLYLRYRDRTGENYVMRYNDQHKWWYFPGMEDDKVIVLKTYDSDEGRARFVGHSAFVDPRSKEDARPRESVEIRTIAFFEVV